MPYCPHCGKEVPEDAKYCANCGEAIYLNFQQTEQKGLAEHIKSGTLFALAHPLIFIPEALAGLWSKSMGWAMTKAVEYFNIEAWYNDLYPQMTSTAYNVQDYENLPPEFWYFGLAMVVLMLVWMSVSGLFTFTLVHMVWSSYKEENINIAASFRYILRRFGRLFLASFIGNMLTFTVILIPAVLFMFAVMVVDETGIREGLSKGFSLSMKRLGASVVLVAAYFILQVVFDYIPYVGDILFALPSSIITVIIVELYIGSKTGYYS